MRPLGSLTSRIFVASALLAVSSILAAWWFVNRTVTAQAEREIARSLDDAARLVDEHRRLSLVQLTQAARLIADLPKFKAAVALDDPPTVAPLAADYRRQLDADVLVVISRTGRLLARDGALAEDVAAASTVALVGDAGARASFLPSRGGILQLVSVPVWIDPAAPDVLGWLTVGIALDTVFASRIRDLTESEIAFAWERRVRAASLPPGANPALDALLAGESQDRVEIAGEEFAAAIRPLGGLGDTPSAAWSEHGSVVVLRSRTAHLRPLRALNAGLALTALIAVLLAVLSSYFVARTVTRPIRAIAGTMREMASSGDLTRHQVVVGGTPGADEDARVLADTFNAMTASLARAQREEAQRERLSTLGRLSTVIAHEIRNPLMIIKTALRSLRRGESADATARAAVADIDEEVNRLNRLVNEVLDFARPIPFRCAPASVSAICTEAAHAAAADGAGPPCQLDLDASADEVVTDAERLRQALVNLLVNARQAVVSRADGPAQEAAGASMPPILLTTRPIDPGTIRIVVRDNGHGADGATLARAFEPFFTTKPTGTGIGLAITRNIVEGLGGTIRATSEPGVGTEMIVDLPRRATCAEPTP